MSCEHIFQVHFKKYEKEIFTTVSNIFIHLCPTPSIPSAIHPRHVAKLLAFNGKTCIIIHMASIVGYSYKSA